MKLINLTLFLSFLFFFSCTKDDSVEQELILDSDGTARVVGYLPQYKFDFNNNLAFANPGVDGKLIINDFNNILVKARADNSKIKIYISIGGGYLTDVQASTWSNLIDIEANRPEIINEIVSFVVDNNFDGVDVDLEWQYVTPGYSPFVIQLKTALSAKGKGMTAALPGVT